MAQPHDLSAILATLAQFSQSSTNTASNSSFGSQGFNTPESYNVPPEASNSIAAAHNASVEGLSQEVPLDPRLRNRPQSRSITPQVAPSQNKAVIDPATITTWQDGLRCVTKIAAQNKAFEASIRKMMKEQRGHEMRWYQERQALKQAQANRSSSTAQALSILQSLNQDFVPEDQPPPEDRKQAELAAFDSKVYAAQQSMETAMTCELKSLGVPFFGTSESLVLLDGSDASELQLPASHPKHSPPVTESRLLELRRKMVKHLEDLYRD